jgi:hypothetical protein
MSKYRVIEFQMMEKRLLKKHAAAMLPMMDDDRAAIKSSIDERGIIQPLLVLEKPAADGKYQVIDGCNRFDCAAAGDKLPCMMVESDDPRAVALECLATGRRRTTGQRIMVFLMMHKKEVLKAAELGQVAKGGNSFGLSRDRPKISGIYADFTPDAIAERLQVSNKDVICAIELFRCWELELHPVVYRDMKDERPLDLADENDRLAKDTTAVVFNHVLAGGTAIRKWKAAWGGRKKTTGPQGRPPEDYEALFDRGLKHLRTVLAANAWHEIPALKREKLADLFGTILQMMPDDWRSGYGSGRS